MGVVIPFAPRGSVSGIEGVGRYEYLYIEANGAARLRCRKDDTQHLFGTHLTTYMRRRDALHHALWEETIRHAPDTTRLRCLGGGYLYVGTEVVVIGGSSLFGAEPERDRRTRTLIAAVLPNARLLVIE